MKLQKNLHHNKLEGNMTMCALITFTEVPLKTWAKPRGGVEGPGPEEEN